MYVDFAYKDYIGNVIMLIIIHKVFTLPYPLPEIARNSQSETPDATQRIEYCSEWDEVIIMNT